MEDKEQKGERKKIKKEDIIGFVFGISIAWLTGLGGFIPYIVGIVFGVWFTRKMLNSKKQYAKVIFWILFVAIFLLGSLFYGTRLNSSHLWLNEEDNSFIENNKTTILVADRITIPKFIRYSGEGSGFNFSILFPTTDPKIYDLDLEVGYIKSYQAQDIINLEENKFVQYSVFFFTIPGGKKILSAESIKAYLTNYPESKSASSNGILTKKEMTTFKGFPAIEYVFSDEMHGVKMIHKGIAFIVKGIPIDLSIVYTNITSESNVHYNDYIRSFSLSRD
jgi:hypothetical protein